jgi:hypothetical protein
MSEMKQRTVNAIPLKKLRSAEMNPSIPDRVLKVDVKSILYKKGWFIKQRQSSGHKIWSRINLIQWLTQISGWVYVIKALVTIFLIDEHSEWNHYLGDYTPAFGKSNLLIIFLD